jgi:hypothetical protein
LVISLKNRYQRLRVCETELACLVSFNYVCLIVAMFSCRDNYYLASTSAKAKRISKLTGQLIDAVGWDRRPSANVRPFLVGTSTGKIFECSIEGKERHAHQVGTVCCASHCAAGRDSGVGGHLM